MSYAITPMEGNSKDRIYQPPVCEALIIPKRVSNILVVGSVGSGKTNLVRSLFTRPEFYKGQFDRIVLVSPSCKTDDLQRELDVAEEDLIDDLDTAPQKIKALLESQLKAIEDVGGNDKAPVVALIYDDCVGHRDLMNSAPFLLSFLANRHHNLTTVLCSQQMRSIPKKIRVNAMSLFFYSGSQQENETVAEEFSVPGFSKKRMLFLVQFATGGSYNFLHINRKKPFAERYSRNLDEQIILDSVPEG